MSELLAVALVCAATLSAAECSRDTALDVIVAPVASPVTCLRQAQIQAAATGAPGEGRYLKIVCEHRARMAAVPGFVEP